MKTSKASNALKILLTIFSLGVVFIATYALPIIAEEMIEVYPELINAKVSILIITELLLFLLLLGVGVIFYLLVLFDRNLTFTLKFTRGLEVLVGMCIIAVIGIVILFQYLSLFGGPGPLNALIMIGMIFVILIVAMVIILIRAIVKKTIVYKTDYDLTV